MGTKLNNMGFKLRSGNKISFKSMGSSPTKQKDNGGSCYIDDRGKTICPPKTDEEKKKDQERIEAQIKGTYEPTEEDIKKKKEDAREDIGNIRRTKSPAKQIEPKGGETYKQYLDRAFKGTKDPYAQDVSGRRWKGKYEGPKTKRFHKKATKKATIKKVAKKVGGKILSKAIPGVGLALLASDVVGVVKKMKKGKTFKKAVKKQFTGLD